MFWRFNMSSFDLRCAKKMIKLQQSAKSRGLEFNLSYTSVKNIMRANKCYFTGKPLTNETRSVDRVDNTKGYVTGNVVACDIRVNRLKDNLTMSELESMFKKLNKRVK